MQFLLIVVISLVVLGIIAAIASIGSTDDPIVQKEGDCASCTSQADCKLKELKERRREGGEVSSSRPDGCRHPSYIIHLTSLWLFHEEQHGEEPLLAVVYRPLQHLL